jgi:hypothetical protein
VHLAQFVFFGTEVMRQNTASTLDAKKMQEIKHIILGKYKDAHKIRVPFGTNAEKQ